MDTLDSPPRLHSHLPPASGTGSGVSLRAVAVGLLAEALTFAWVADSEIRQSVYLICYSLLMPAVVVLVGLLLINTVVRRVRPRSLFTSREMAVVYIMLTCALPVAGFGGLRFILPSMGLPFYRTTPDNWGRFADSLPRWLVPHDQTVWRGFFRGQSPVPWAAWLAPLLFWCAFLLELAGLWICLSLLLRKRWIEQERLTFPIVYLPLQMVSAPRVFFGSPVMWLGFAIPAVLQSALALNHLYPAIPAVQLKAWDASVYFTSAPLNAIGYLPIGLYPTAIGLAYFIPTDISFSCWFFYLLTRALNVAGAAMGYDMTGQSGAAVRFPYPQEQAAGAWIALGLLALWSLRAGRGGGWAYGSVGDRPPRRPYSHTPILPLGAALCAGAAWAMATAAGVPPVGGALMLAIYGLYVVCGARVRAEVGAQWTFSPLVWTASQTTIHTLGAPALGERGLVMTSLFEAQNVDVRGQAMPNDLEGLKLADSLSIRPRSVAWIILLATTAGIGLACYASVTAWYGAGAATAHANVYALNKAQIVWRTLATNHDNRTAVDMEGLLAAGAGAAITLVLARMRLASLSWPFHPIGYVLANTLTVNAFWVPFFLAWLCKSLVRRYAGIRLYRQSVLFFVGIILGDVLTQSFWTLAGRLLGFPVYQFLS